MEQASPNRWQGVREAAHQFGLRAFWRWWVGELAPLVPAGLRNAARRRRLRPVLAFDADSAVLWVPATANGGLAYEEASRVALSPDAAETASAGRAAIAALPATYGGPAAGAKVVVAVPADQVLRKSITLPAAVEGNLAQALAYDLDRHTPFKPDELYFDAAVVARDPAKREIRVELAAALRTVVDLMRRRAESWGAVVIGVTPDSPSGAAAAGGPAFNLLPETERPEASAWRRPEIWIPLLLIALLAVAAIALPIWQKRGYAIALAQLAEQGRVEAEASNALREQLEQLTGDYNFALRKKYAFPSAVQVVEDVTRILPDDTWLTQFEVKSTLKGKEPSREILVRGESGNAGRLISLLEDSRLFEQAAPRSPTTKIQPGPGEIFDLGAQLKPIPPPEPVPASAAGANAAAAAPPAPGTEGSASPPLARPASAPTGHGTAPPPAPQGGAPAPTGQGTAPALAPQGALSAPATQAAAPPSAPVMQGPAPAQPTPRSAPASSAAPQANAPETAAPVPPAAAAKGAP